MFQVYFLDAAFAQTAGWHCSRHSLIHDVRQLLAASCALFSHFAAHSYAYILDDPTYKLPIALFKEFRLQFILEVTSLAVSMWLCAMAA